MRDEPTGEVNPSDHLLLQRIRDGEQDAATALFLKYGARLRALARSRTSTKLASRFDADDVIQSVFRTFFRRASQGLYDVPEGDELWQLLLVIALNKIRDLAVFHQAGKRDVSKTKFSPELEDANLRSGADRESIGALEVVLKDFLLSLPPIQAQVATLRMEGFQVDEISKKTNRSKRTVERTLNELRKNLIKRLDIEQ